MPKKLEDCVKSLIEQGYTKQQAFAICTASIEKDKQKDKKGKPRTL
jgi:predicted Ser/Thr protein kinase